MKRTWNDSCESRIDLLGPRSERRNGRRSKCSVAVAKSRIVTIQGVCLFLRLSSLIHHSLSLGPHIRNDAAGEGSLANISCEHQHDDFAPGAFFPLLTLVHTLNTQEKAWK